MVMDKGAGYGCRYLSAMSSIVLLITAGNCGDLTSLLCQRSAMRSNNGFFSPVHDSPSSLHSRSDIVELPGAMFTKLDRSEEAYHTDYKSTSETPHSIAS